MGAKNHAVIMPDAHSEATINALAGAAFGAAGQRCMAVSAAVFVGGIGPWKDALIAKAKSLKVRLRVAGLDIRPLIATSARLELCCACALTQAPRDKQGHVANNAMASVVSKRNRMPTIAHTEAE